VISRRELSTRERVRRLGGFASKGTNGRKLLAIETAVVVVLIVLVD
jgi:hypothetical protein